MISMAGDTAGDTQEKAKARVEKIFQVMDIDGNGELSREEFLQAAKRDQSIVAALNFIRCWRLIKIEIHNILFKINALFAV